MSTIKIAAVLILLISIALLGQQTPSPAPSISVTSTGDNSRIADGSRESGPPGRTPVYRINLRVHNGQSTLPAADLRTSLEEMNFIWWSQTGVCFEITSTKDDTTGRDGFDIWFVPLVPDPVGANGVYKGDHNIWSRDHPSLTPAPNAVTHAAARTSAHELGHALALPHYNGYADSAESLMSSGTLGWHLHDFEIQAARTHALRKAVSDMTPIHCGAPQIN